jgi:hypothetical protein
MSPERRHQNGAAIAVITWVNDMLQAWGQIDSAPHMRGVVSLKNIFAAVAEMTIPQ